MILNQLKRNYRHLLKGFRCRTWAIEKGIAGATCGLRESDRFAKAAIPSPTSASHKPQAMPLSTTVPGIFYLSFTSNTMRFVHALSLIPLVKCFVHRVCRVSRDGFQRPFLSTIRHRTCSLTTGIHRTNKNK